MTRSVTDIAAELKVHPRTVSRALKRQSPPARTGRSKESKLDNQKAAVLAHQAGRHAHFQPRFVDLAQHYGFTPKACQPYRARTKGKDERMILDHQTLGLHT